MLEPNRWSEETGRSTDLDLNAILHLEKKWYALVVLSKPPPSKSCDTFPRNSNVGVFWKDSYRNQSNESPLDSASNPFTPYSSKEEQIHKTSRILRNLFCNTLPN